MATSLAWAWQAVELRRASSATKFNSLLGVSTQKGKKDKGQGMQGELSSIKVEHGHRLDVADQRGALR